MMDNAGRENGIRRFHVSIALVDAKNNGKSIVNGRFFNDHVFILSSLVTSGEGNKMTTKNTGGYFPM